MGLGRRLDDLLPDALEELPLRSEHLVGGIWALRCLRCSNARMDVAHMRNDGSQKLPVTLALIEETLGNDDEVGDIGSDAKAIVEVSL